MHGRIIGSAFGEGMAALETEVGPYRASSIADEIPDSSCLPVFSHPSSSANEFLTCSCGLAS